MIKSTLKIPRYCPLVIQGFSNFLGLFQGIMANPVSLTQIDDDDDDDDDDNHDHDDEDDDDDDDDMCMCI